MKKYMNKSPEEVMKMVTTELITRGIKLGRIKKRTLPNTTPSPYLLRVRQGSVAGWNPPAVKTSDRETGGKE